jgi:histidine triad (HIT) family protein
VSDHTIFDRILRKELPADVVFEDETVLAFRDVNPQAPVHVLVIPKRRVARFAGLRHESAADVGAFFQKVAEGAAALRLDERGYRVVVNNGPDGQQSVEYLHAHILGGRPLSWPPG